MAQKVESRGRKRKNPEPEVFDSTDFDSQDESLEQPKAKRQRLKNDTSATSSDGEKVKTISKEETSDTDSQMGKKAKKRIKVDATAESEVRFYNYH
jgi:hypothetical protein